MSASEDSNQGVELGSLSHYDSMDLTEVLRKLQSENVPKHQKEEAKRVLMSLSNSQPGAAVSHNAVNLHRLAEVANNPSFNQLNQRGDEPWLEILEQPKSKGIRFRYKCEGRSAGSIPGETSTSEHKTFPAVKINNFKGPAAIVVVSCVTKDEPYRPHPHTLVGKECKKGVCTVKLRKSNTATFPNLGIQCVTKKEIKDSLKEREEIRVDPFGTGYYDGLQKLHLNIVRLCFQAFLPDANGQYTKIVNPVVSQCIFDKKAVNDLVVCRLSKQSGHVKGGDEVFMLCEKVNKDDIQVRFFEEIDDEPVWESYGDFGPSDVHRQYAIVFKTPPYHNQNITHPVEVQMQLFRPSDEGYSEPKMFQYIPNDPDPEGINRKRKRKMNFTNFFADNNVNTPAFNLITKDDSDAPKSSATVKERLKAKASKSRKADAVEDVPQYTAAVHQAMAFQSGINQLTVGEVVVETTDLQDMRYSPQQTAAAALTQLSIHPQPLQAESALHTQAVGGEDSDDIMLEDIPLTRVMADSLNVAKQEDQLPSMPSLPSVEFTSEIMKPLNSVDLQELGFIKQEGKEFKGRLVADSAPTTSQKPATKGARPKKH